MTKTVKIAYNDCFGGFGLSDEGFQLLLTKKGIDWEMVPKDPYSLTRFSYRRRGDTSDDTLDQNEFTSNRTDPDLIAVIEELGKRANGSFAKLAIREIEKGAPYRIDEYDGSESVMVINDYEWSIA